MNQIFSTSYSLAQAVALAWAAGFTDGEGCIHISKQLQPGRKSPTYRPRLDVSQNNREVLVRLREDHRRGRRSVHGETPTKSCPAAVQPGLRRRTRTPRNRKAAAVPVSQGGRGGRLADLPGARLDGYSSGPRRLCTRGMDRARAHLSAPTGTQATFDRRRLNMGTNDRFDPAKRELDRIRVGPSPSLHGRCQHQPRCCRRHARTPASNCSI